MNKAQRYLLKKNLNDKCLSDKDLKYTSDVMLEFQLNTIAEKLFFNFVLAIVIAIGVFGTMKFLDFVMPQDKSIKVFLCDKKFDNCKEILNENDKR